jgi:hypothetical protein
MAFSGQIWSSKQIRECDDDVPASIKIVMRWISSFIANPHENLGRTGAVCPYVPPALKMDSMWLTHCDRGYSSEEEMCQTVMDCLNLFQELDREGEAHLFKALVVIFPEISHDLASSLIGRVQKSMKPTIVRAGMMLGEFFDGNDSPGLYNAELRPLRSPIPLFVYRRLVVNDLRFLTKSTDQPEHRVDFLLSYLRVLSDRLPPEIEREARAALAIAKSEIDPQ